jgi:hypothetical protein
LPDGLSGIFFAWGLDNPNHAEITRKFRFFAQAKFSLLQVSCCHFPAGGLKSFSLPLPVTLIRSLNIPTTILLLLNIQYETDSLWPSSAPAPLSNDVKRNFDHTHVDHPKSFGRSRCNVDDTSPNIWTTVIDAHDYRFSIQGICHAQARAER